MFGGGKIQREYKDVIAAIEKGSRRDPQHNPAASIEKDGAALLRPEHRIVWSDFGRFGEIINVAMHHGPWSFEETDRVTFGFDGPDYGRHYRVWYNDMPAGSLQIGVAHLMMATEGHGAMAELDLDFPQLVPEPELRDMLRTMSFMFMRKDDGVAMRAQADLEVLQIMTRHLWEVQRRPDLVLGMHWRFEGPYEHYSEYLK
ncbi:hypothetical protein GCM10011321_14430 [Youhaiella tibetensis]|uniref:Uncharacterized protein n=1 Tax=Paradevosia tibetensis TaxID=1447062 RepID=A0A5B9DMU9_9HYPH|nr:hypothetical protein [Youhaiella tibetensis]QEE20433.1 hypothetical protein FNA67_09730 [Youhaiella tibetensis]GGF24182.1 hypothetical protein GCM10011321_14430 [Youhaiella tibetensis]